jgi:hypothetical protein
MSVSGNKEKCLFENRQTSEKKLCELFIFLLFYAASCIDDVESFECEKLLTPFTPPPHPSPRQRYAHTVSEQIAEFYFSAASLLCA